jgi:predicted permease
MLNDLLYRLRALFHRDAMEAELEEELQFHFEREIEKHRRAGMTEQEARRRARLAIGGHEQVKEDCRDARGTTFLEQSIQDARYALRQLWANPTFALVMILTLALSIGANSAIFSVVESVLIRSLPYEQPDRIVRLFMSEPMYPRFPLNPFDFRDFRSRSRSFTAMAGFTRDDLQLSGGSGQPEQLHGFDITAGYFRVLGLHPELGHEFTERNEVPNSGRQVIISDRLWRTRFGADPAILGRKVTLNAMPFTVIGVMPQGVEHPGNEYHPMAYGESVDVWTPFWFEGNPANRGSHFLEVIARLKDGVTPAHAREELSAIMAQMAHEQGGDTRWQVLAVPLEQEIVGSSRQMLLVLLGAVGMVLLIACANAANLLLARAASRQRELAVRLALGAPRSRLIRQLLTESLIIALAGGVLGLVLAAGGVRAMVSLLPDDFPRVHDIHLSVPVFAFTMLVSLSTGILFGLAPAIQVSRTDPKNGLHEGGRSATASGRQSRLRDALVISEVTLACVLLIGAGLMLRSLLNLLRLDPGFRQDHVLTASLSLPDAEYRDKISVERFFGQLTTELQSMPGVEAVGAGSDLPWTGWDENTSFNIEGKQPPPKEFFHARYHVATPDYFRALGTPLLSGRFFTDADKDGAPAVVLVNQAMAEKYWPHENVVGKRITFEDKPADKDWLTIVGVVASIKDKPNSTAAAPGFWWPHLQAQYHNMSLVVRSQGDPQATMDAMRNEVHRLNPGLAVSHLELMNEIVEQSVATPRIAFILVGLFAALAILLAAIGTYGVIAYAVSRRTSEFGLRLALGARRFDLLRLVLAQGARLAVLGTVLGILMSLGLGRVMRSLIYGVSPADPLIFVSVAFMVLAIAFLASYMPARRAAQADPMTALRSE